MQLAHWFKQKESEIDAAEVNKVKGLWHWIAAADARSDNSNEEVESIIAKPWKSFSYVKGEAFV